MGFIRKLTGEKSARLAANIQAQSIADAQTTTQAATEQALGFQEPFAGVGQQGIEQAGFLTDPKAQFAFLQENPIFQFALEQANRGTQNLAAARGRLSAGDTLQQLTQNALLSAQPLISGQKQSITDLLNLGTGVAGRQSNIAIGQGSDIADLITSRGDVRAAGEIAGGNALRSFLTDIASTAGTIASTGGFSDERLKENITKIGNEKGFNIYFWTWNKLGESIGLFGESFGVIAQEVMKIKPEAVTEKNGYLAVNYDMIGINHGD